MKTFGLWGEAIMNSNHDLELDRARCDQLEKILQHLNALLMIENRPVTCYTQIRASLLEATVQLQQAKAMYRVIIDGQERAEGKDGNDGSSLKIGDYRNGP
jgi:hypothetical protein